MKYFIKRLFLHQDLIPSFSLREMVLLTVLFLWGGFFFIQSFRTYQDEFNHVLDDIFQLSELHADAKSALKADSSLTYRHNSQEADKINRELVELQEDLVEDMSMLPGTTLESSLIYKFNAFFVQNNDKEIRQLFYSYNQAMDQVNREYPNFQINRLKFQKAMETLMEQGISQSNNNSLQQTKQERELQDIQTTIILKTLLHVMGDDEQSSLPKILSAYQGENLKGRKGPNLDSIYAVMTALSELKSSQKKIIEYPFQTLLSELYSQLRHKQMELAYISNNYRSATYFILILIVTYGSQIFLRHYAKARKRAIESSNAKTDFLANMSHEIRTPLNGIFGMSELLESTNLDVTQSRYIKSLKLSAEGLTELINDILDISKIESGHIDLEKISFNLLGLIEDILLSFKFRIDSKNISLIKDYNFDTSSNYLGDPARIRQILINLIGNAIKFTETGHIKVTCKQIDLQQDKFYFEIEDTGIGIPENSRKNIFQKFSQADTSTTRKYGGTGLGLAICKKLIDLMHGEINYKKNEHNGTTFWMNINLEKDTKTPLTFPTVSLSRDYNFLKGKSVLLAEDNKINQEYALKILSDMNLNVTLAETGIEALTCFKKSGRPYDIILMDCRMPEMDGYKTTQEIRAYESANRLERTPIIALTANAIKGDLEHCLRCGMDDYLTKPIQRRILEDAILKWLNQIVHHRSTQYNAGDVAPTLPQFPNDLPLIDHSIFNEMKDIMDDEFNKVITTYITITPEYLNAMREGLKEKSVQKISDAAHPLKSSSASLGALQLQDICQNIEKNSTETDNLEHLAQLITDAEKIALKTIKELENLIA